MTDSIQPSAILTVSLGPGAGRSFTLGAAPVTIGRQAQCDIQIQDTWMSRRHAHIAWTGTSYIVEDLGSTNGTFVNGERVVGPRALQTGDLLQLGDQVELAFQASVTAPVHEEPISPGAAPYPVSSAPSPQDQASPPEAKRGKVKVWALGLLGLILVLAAGGVAYYLLADGDQPVADTPAEGTDPTEPASATSTAAPAPTPTEVASPVIAQANATFAGPMTISRRGTNATAEGAEIKFATSADGAALVSMSYSLFGGECTYVSGSSTTTVSGSSESTLFFNEPVPITDGRFVVDFMGIRAKGTLTSPTEANGEITIDKEESMMSPTYQTFVCHYGTWTWTASSE